MKSAYFITGVNNKKSIAYSVAKTLLLEKENCVFSVQNQEQYDFIKIQFPDSPVLKCNLAETSEIANWPLFLKDQKIKLKGLLHSVAFARLNPEWSFESTPWDAFQEALRISCFSLMELSHHLKPFFEENASVVTLSISNTRATCYGYLGPIKAMLNSLIDYLAKSFSKDSRVRFNAVAAGPLKTSASAGIPGYVDNYLFSEQLTLRKNNLTTQEVADTTLFLLSEKSSGLNGTTITVDAGMSVNYFDEEVVNSWVSRK